MLRPTTDCSVRTSLRCASWRACSINLVALFAFGEKLGGRKERGAAVGILSVALLTFGPSLSP